jgi:2-oxoglutarate dehydrogenase E2 component (dihydrolipoamide succinyltransferase)
VNAPKAGKITELLVKEEETVTVGQDLFRYEPGEAGARTLCPPSTKGSAHSISGSASTTPTPEPKDAEKPPDKQAAKVPPSPPPSESVKQVEPSKPEDKKAERPPSSPEPKSQPKPPPLPGVAAQTTPGNRSETRVRPLLLNVCLGQ